jgi:hypothetical protein
MEASRAFRARRSSHTYGTAPRAPRKRNGAAGAWVGAAGGLLLVATLAIWTYRFPDLLGRGGRVVLAGAVVFLGAALIRSIGRR